MINSQNFSSDYYVYWSRHRITAMHNPAHDTSQSNSERTTGSTSTVAKSYIISAGRMLRPHGIRPHAHGTEVPKRGSISCLTASGESGNDCHSKRAKQGSYIHSVACLEAAIVTCRPTRDAIDHTADTRR